MKISILWKMKIHLLNSCFTLLYLSVGSTYAQTEDFSLGWKKIVPALALTFQGRPLQLGCIPTLGYSLPRNFETGVGCMYVASRAQTVRGNTLRVRTHHAYGPLIFVQKRLPVSATAYLLLYTDVGVISYRPSLSVPRKEYLMQHLGVGMGFDLSKKFHLFVQILYNPLHSTIRSPYAGARHIRAGIRL